MNHSAKVRLSVGRLAWQLSSSSHSKVTGVKLALAESAPSGAQAFQKFGAGEKQRKG